MARTLTLQLDDRTYQLFDEAAKAQNRPLAAFIEKSVLAWLRQQRTLDDTENGPSPLQQAVAEAEKGIAQGRWVEHETVAAKLRRWAAGDP
jgi:predicted transcriptional regulator